VRILFRTVMLLVGMFFPFHQALADDKDKKSTWVFLSIDDLCATISLMWYTTASHPGGNADGRHNEDTTGHAVLCYLNKDRNFYLKYGDLRNSRNGSTKHYGFGAVTNIFTLRHGNHSVGPRLGAETLRVNYEVPEHNVTIAETFTVPYGGIGYQYGKNLFFAANQYLLRGGVTLRSFELTYSVKKNIF
jgi:hypothetical protein